MLFDLGEYCNCGPTESRLWKVYVPACSGTSWGTGYVESPTAGVPGMVCQLYAESARTTLVASGTTNSVGRVDVAAPAAGLYYARLTHPSGRFVDLNPGSAVDLASATSVTVAYLPAAAAGYHCARLCRIPIADVLYMSSPVGAATLNWTAGTWVGYVTYTPAGSGSCPSPSSLTLNVGFDAVTGVCTTGGNCKREGAGVTAASTPCVGLSPGCPCDDGDRSWATPSVARTALSCPTDAFYLAASGLVNTSSGTYAKQMTAVFGTGVFTHSYTVTE